MQSYKHVTERLQVKIKTVQKICIKDRCRPSRTERPGDEKNYVF